MRPAGAYVALQSAVSNLGEPVAPTPPSGGLSHFLAVVTRSSSNRGYPGPRVGKAGPSGLTPRLLRPGRAGRRHGRASASALRGTGLRAKADRPQLARP